jgi:hypothetical protein
MGRAAGRGAVARDQRSRFGTGLAEASRLCRVGIVPHVETNRVEPGSGPLRGSADALERGVERIGRAAVGMDVLDRGLGASDAELRAEQVRDRLGVGLARGEVWAGDAVGGEEERDVRCLLHRPLPSVRSCATSRASEFRLPVNSS